MPDAQPLIPLSAIVQPLLRWYESNRRILPWRDNTDPYRVWISEVMLQQTRVESVLPFYNRFLSALPDIAALAECDDAKLMKLWEGLGYYSRVRNLKKAAVKIISNYHGVFPQSYDDIRRLPGIGDYSAGSIASICFELPRAAVDGNVVRVIARLSELSGNPSDSRLKSLIRASLEKVYPNGHCGDFTQSLMELGALICLPHGLPCCGDCPLKTLCKANQHQTIDDFPQKALKKERKKEDFTVFIIHCGEQVALRKRPDSGVLAGMWEYPNLPGRFTEKQATKALERWNITPASIRKGKERRHIFTHLEWSLPCWLVETDDKPDTMQWFTAEQLVHDISLPTAFRKFFSVPAKK